MPPKHANPDYLRREHYRSVAPYNFVPLPDEVKTTQPDDLPRHDEYSALTGCIECELTTRTPLYTRTALTPEFFRRWGDKVREMLQRDPAARDTYAQFFHLGDAAQPLIPGSSLRGMVRALVEIVGSAKVQWVTGESLVYRAVGDTTGLGQSYRRQLVDEQGHKLTPKMQAGYMEKDGPVWFIRPAQLEQGVSFARIAKIPQPLSKLSKWRGCANAFHIWVKLGAYDFQPVQEGHREMKWIPATDPEMAAPKQAGYKEAVLVVSGRMNNKQREAVFFLPHASAARIEVDDDLVRRYREQISPGQQELLGNADGVLRDGQPVFYLLDGDNKLVFFGHTMMFRLPYLQSPLDLVPEELRDRQRVDLAEAIFGYAPQGRDDQRKAYAGRVYFGDARLAESQSQGERPIWWRDEPFAPQILSGPKPTAFQHYLTQQEPDDVDSGQRTRDGRVKLDNPLDHYASPPPHYTTIRGTKVYWQRRVDGAEDVMDMEFAAREHAWEGNGREQKPDTQHTIIRPVRDGLRFNFCVRFENLRPEELGLLLWALQPGGAADAPEAVPEYCHKLGMGKPLGLGSVKLAVTALSVEAREDRVARYKTLFVDPLKDTPPGAGNEDRCQWHKPAQRVAATHGAAQVAQEVARYKRRFEEFMVGSEGRFADGERMRMLLKLMQWPGPAREDTRYMTLEEFKPRPVLPDPLHAQARLHPGHQSGLRAPIVQAQAARRPGAGHGASTPAAAHGLQAGARSASPPDRQPSKHAAAIEDAAKWKLGLVGSSPARPETGVQGPAPADAGPSATDAQSPHTADAVLPGMLIKVVVARAQADAVHFTTTAEGVEATLTLERAGLSAADELADRFPVGSEHALWVVGVNKRGRVQLTTKRPRQG